MYRMYRSFVGLVHTICTKRYISVCQTLIKNNTLSTKLSKILSQLLGSWGWMISNYRYATNHSLLTSFPVLLCYSPPVTGSSCYDSLGFVNFIWSNEFVRLNVLQQRLWIGASISCLFFPLLLGQQQILSYWFVLFIRAFFANYY